MFRDLSRGFEKLFFPAKIVEQWGYSEMPGATLVSARPFYHILLKMSIGKMHKKLDPLPAV